MHTGFKGSRIGINRLLLEGEALSYELVFVDDDGVVHGTMRHALPVDADSNIKSKIDALIDMLIARAAKDHFAQPGEVSSLTMQSNNDLASSLGASAAEADEPEGTQD